MRVEKLRAWHFHQLELQDAQRYFLPDVSSEAYGQAVEASPFSYSAFVGDTLIACAGCVEIWDNRAMAWALVSKDAGRHFFGVHRFVSGFLAAAKWRRVEAYVDAGFEPGMRWMRMLGFMQETPEPMRSFRPDGHDCFMFARVK
jgi:hypothetical protein